MKRTMTIFRSSFDTDTSNVVSFESWNDMKDSLFDISEKQMYKPSKDDKSYHPKGYSPAILISPAIYKEGTTRANDNVLAWAGWVAIDVDSMQIPYSELHDKFEDIGINKYEYVCYSTASCKEDKVKFRLLFPLTRHIDNTEIRHFWFALNKMIDDQIDPQTKDFSRMFYVPATYHNAFNFIFTNSGDMINPSKLMNQFEYFNETKNFDDFLDSNTRNKLFEHARKKLKNSDIHWSSYKDCPFINQKLVNEYENTAFNDGTGRYAMIYRIISSIAFNAIKNQYPISPQEIASLIREIDYRNSKIYNNRPIELESKRAIEYALKNSMF